MFFFSILLSVFFPPQRLPELAAQIYTGQFVQFYFCFSPDCSTFRCGVFAFLKVPEWASPADHTVGGVVLLWRLGSFKEPPVYGRLLFSLNVIPVLLISSQCTTVDHLQLVDAFQANWDSGLSQNMTR